MTLMSAYNPQSWICVIVLAQEFVGTHAARLGHIILNPSPPVFALTP